MTATIRSANSAKLGQPKTTLISSRECACALVRSCSLLTPAREGALLNYRLCLVKVLLNHRLPGKKEREARSIALPGVLRLSVCLLLSHSRPPSLPYSLPCSLPYSRTPVLPPSRTPISPYSRTPVLDYSITPVLPSPPSYSLPPVLPYSRTPSCTLVLPPVLPYSPYSRTPVLPYSLLAPPSLCVHRHCVVCCTVTARPC